MTTPRAAPTELLLDYATGAASPSLALLVASHLALRPDSAATAALLDQVGGEVLSSLEDEPLERISAESVLALAEDPPAPGRAEAPPVAELAPAVRRRLGPAGLPPPLMAFADDFARTEAWRSLGVGIKVAQLKVPDAELRAHLLWATPATRIPAHRHRGMEAVLVLRGAFLADGERFAAGDIAYEDGDHVHELRIDRGEACVCLVVSAAPVEFIGPFRWALNRFCRF